MRREYLVVAVALLLATAGFGVVSAQSPAAVGGATGAQSADTAQQAQQASCDYAALYDQTIDSVVGVRTASGQGSGFVYQSASGDGASYVVTNAHVVGDASSVTVQFSNEASSTGEVVGTDAIADLAVVRVDAPSGVEALPVASSTPDPGEKVAAIGSPFGLDETITHGIVSGVNRSLPTGQNAAIPTVVQTDAPINPGNSGGPLVTCDGTVVGVNTAGLQASRADNIGFAVPSTLVERVVPALVENGSYAHSNLGVAVHPVTPQLAAANDLNTTEGVYVHQARAGSPAADVLQGTTESTVVGENRVPVGGDVVVAIDGRQVNTTKALGAYLFTETRPGEAVTLTVVRDGERRQVEVTLGEWPEPEAA